MPKHPPLTLREAILAVPGDRLLVTVEALGGGDHRLCLRDHHLYDKAVARIAPFPSRALAAPDPGLRSKGTHEVIAAFNAWALVFFKRMAPAAINLSVHAGTVGRRRKERPPLPPLLDPLVRPLIQARGVHCPDGGVTVVNIDAERGTDPRPNVRISTGDAAGRLQDMLHPGASLVRDVGRSVLPWWQLAAPWLSGAADITIRITVPQPSAHERMAAIAALDRDARVGSAA